MSITLDDVSCLLHLPIKGDIPRSWEDYPRRGSRDNGRVSEADPEKVMKEVGRTMSSHARFEFLRRIYANEIQREEHDDGDVEQMSVHKSHALRAYLLFWLELRLLWTRVPLILTLSTYVTSWISSGSMSTTEGQLAWSTCIRS